MRQTVTLRRSALCSASFVGLALALAAPAYAETGTVGNAQPTCDPADRNCQPGQSEVELESGTVAQTGAQGEPAQGENQITVTGSRIRRPNLESNVPVTSVSAADLTEQGDVNVGDALNDLPAIRSTYSQANSTRFIGTTGLNLLDLRGLGVTRTLVLVNGRRHVTASPGDFIVDTNTIPTDLIERVDVVTGGSSAVYGSDAIAGVVNFVLRNNFEGVRLRAQGGISDEGDRGIYFASLTAGQNFLDDRANLAINLEYAHAEPLYFRDRRIQGFQNGRCQFNLAENTAGEPRAGNGVPDQTLFCGVRNARISTGGTLEANASLAQCQSAAFGPGGASAAIGAARCYNPGTAQGAPRLFRFNTSGNLVETRPALDFRPIGSGNYIANPNDTVLGSTLRETGQFAPGLDRYTANVLGHIDISPAFQPFFEGKYVHIRSLQEGQPSFFQSIANTIGAPNLRCDNAFITNLAQIQALGYCSNGAVSNQTVPLGRFNVDFGGRSEIVERDTWRVVGGFRGEFNGDWNYEISATYGEVKIHQDELNDLVLTDVNGNFDGFLLAYDAVRNSAGQIVCRVNQTTVTRPDCVPINMFGEGRPSREALAFVNTTSYLDSDASQLDILAYVNGDLSQLFEFPGGPARFVIGGEYRRETAYQIADPLSSAGGTFFNAFPEFDPPAFEVKEAFGELELPLLRDVPFAQELTVTAAARYSDYNTSAGDTFAYNFNGTWAPIRDLRFRANYSHSIRVPTLGDLYSAPSQNFGFVGDPCDIQNINNGTPNRATNCAAQGIPAGFINAPARSQTIGFLSAGNPNLTSETSDSYTAGFVFTPSMVPGLSFTVDYYRITVNNLIAVLGAQTILNQCYDLPQPNQYCSLINPRNPDFTFADPALTSAGVNFAKYRADGIDFELAYTRRLSEDVRLNLRAIATYVIKRNNYTSPTDPTFRDQILFELGDPELAANFTANLSLRNFDIRYSMNYVGEQVVGAYENYYTVDGRTPANPDAFFPNEYPETFTHNLRFAFNATERFQFYMGVDNVFDTLPPLFLMGNEGGVPYDPIGRYFYAGARVDF